MSSFQSASKRKKRAEIKSKRGSEEGGLYEKLSLMLIAKRAYELSKIDNSKFRDFAIGREVKIGKDEKFDDVVFRYRDEDHEKNLIFLQIKHKQEDYQIDSQILSTEATTAKNMGGSDGGMCRDFNLQKYFISYLNVRDELKTTQSKELISGKIKYVAIFTNIGLDSKELTHKGFHLKEAPVDVVNLFTLKKPPSETQHTINHCCQLRDVSEGLRKILKKSSDLHRIAAELAKCVVWKGSRGNRIMGIDDSPIKHYHVALEKHVIQKSDHVENNMKNEPYRECQFRDDFLDCEKEGTEHKLRHAIFEAVRELDESKSSANDDELKRVLKEAKWKIVPNFGKSKQNIKKYLPCKWKMVEDEAVADFLKCLVFIVNQPRVTELEALYKSSIEGIVAENTAFKQFHDNMNNTGPEFRNCIEKAFGIDKKANFKERWISDDQIESFIEENKQLVSTAFAVSAMTLMHRSELTQVGEFRDCGHITGIVDNFLAGNGKIVCVNTPSTLLSSIKILQHLNSEKVYSEENDRISVSLSILNSTENRESVLKAFEFERNNLLIIECRHAIKGPIVDEFLCKLVNIAKGNSSKKIIFITDEENCVIFKKIIEIHFPDERLYVQENDFIQLKYFEPKEDPLKKNVLVFQGQKEKVSLSNLTGIDSWNSYVANLPEDTIDQGIMDVMTLIKILNNYEIEVGSKPLGTSMLEGAYTTMMEKINVETLANKLVSQGADTERNDIYIISGICGSDKQDKISKIVHHLGLIHHKERIENQLKDIGSDGRIQIADANFKDEDFQRQCHDYPEKLIFWISLETDHQKSQFILQKIYNPDFYLKRNFMKVVMMKVLTEILIQEDISDTFIFICIGGQREFYRSVGLSECDKQLFADNCEKGKIQLFTQKTAAEAEFKELSKQNKTVHLLELDEEQFVWRDTHGSIKNLKKYVLRIKSDCFSIEEKIFTEDQLIERIKNKKVVIFANDPGMGKTTTLIKLHEMEKESTSIAMSHWVILIKLRKHLNSIRDIELSKNGIDSVSVLQFLSKTDSKLNNNLAKNLLKIALDKSKDFSKPLLLALDGFDEVLDEDDRSRIIALLKFLKNETAAKIWITTRLHYREILEVQIETLSFELSVLEEYEKVAYVEKYLKDRLHLILDERKHIEFFYSNDEEQEVKNIQTYSAAFLNKMTSIFTDDEARFIGTPLQLYLMLESSTGHFIDWIENAGIENPDFEYIGNDMRDVYEKFVERKYDVYFRKSGIRERKRKTLEKLVLDQFHKDFAKSAILEVNPKYSLAKFMDEILLAGIVQSNGNDPQFIHKSFEEFFAAKVFVDWIKKRTTKFSNFNKLQYLWEHILKDSDHRLTRTFMNLMIKNLKDVPDESLKCYTDRIAKLFNEAKSPLVDSRGTVLHVAAEEGNIYIADFLLNFLKKHSDALKKCILARDEDECSALHLACQRGNLEIVRMLLHAAEEISKATLQKFLKFANICDKNALDEAVENSHNVEILKCLLSRADNKLDLVLNPESSLAVACFWKNEVAVDFLLQIFHHQKRSLKRLLLWNDDVKGNALCNAWSTVVVEKLINSAKSMNDNNETFKKLLLPRKGKWPFSAAIERESTDIAVKFLNVAKNLEDDHCTLKKFLFDDRTGETLLHLAARTGRGDVMELVLNTAADLGTEVLERLIFAVDEKGRNAVHLLVEVKAEDTFADSFKILEGDKYRSIREKVMALFENVPLISRLGPDRRKLIRAIRRNHVQVVKDILSNAKNPSERSTQTLEILLLAKDDIEQSTLFIACKQGHSEIVKELLSCAINMDDRGATLKHLVTNPWYRETPFEAASKCNCARQIEDIVERLIEEARQNKNHLAARILSRALYYNRGTALKNYCVLM